MYQASCVICKNSTPDVSGYRKFTSFTMVKIANIIAKNTAIMLPSDALFTAVINPPIPNPITIKGKITFENKSILNSVR